MQKQTDKLFGLTIKQVLLVLLSIVLLCTPICFALSYPPFVQVTDFGGTFYIAAWMVRGGKFIDLYSFSQSSLTGYAHQVLNSLPSNQSSLFQYPPLLAYLLQPISHFSLVDAFVVWQLLSILVLCLAIFLMASIASLNWIMCFAMTILYLPVLHTLLIGQIGLLLVLLPLSIGYFCLMHNHSFTAGVAWSFVILKMQFLPFIFLLVITLLFAKNWRCAAGFTLGLIVLGVLNMLCLGTQTTYEWLLLLNTSDAVSANPSYSCSPYLEISLPRAILQILPMSWRMGSRIVIYLAVFAIWLHALLVCIQLVKRAKNYTQVMPYVFALGLFLMPLISPHLLFYDLSILALAGIVIYGERRFRTNRNLIRNLQIGWLSIDIYFIVALFLSKILMPILLIPILIWLYIVIYKARQSWFVNDNAAETRA
jgi:hypothetical protein